MKPSSVCHTLWSFLCQKIVVVAVLFIPLVVPGSALAWGSSGHRVVAEISAHYLTAKSIAEIKELLDARDLKAYIAASTWADGIRQQRRETSPWHYVDRPYDSAGYVPARDCANNNCVTARIYEMRRVLADKSLNKAIRAEALKFLIHFVGDIHQPLHAIDDNNDRGGNEVWVRITGRTDRLHSMWDTYLVDKMGKTPSSLAASLVHDISGQERSQWAAGRPENWANESYGIAKDFIYRQSRGKNTKDTPILLPDAYVDQATPLIAQRLQMAGVRLAWLVNGVLR